MPLKISPIEIEEVDKNQTVKHFSNESHHKYMGDLAQHVKKFLHDNTDSFIEKQVLLEKHNLLLKAIDPVYKRIQYNASFSQACTTLHFTIQRARYFVLLEQPINHSWISSEQMVNLTQMVDDYDIYLKNVINISTSLQPWEPNPISPLEVNNKAKHLIEELIRLSKLKSPTPMDSPLKFKSVWATLKDSFKSLFFGNKTKSKTDL